MSSFEFVILGLSIAVARRPLRVAALVVRAERLGGVTPCSTRWRGPS
jgi:hypothetical protein